MITTHFNLKSVSVNELLANDVLLVFKILLHYDKLEIGHAMANFDKRSSDFGSFLKVNLFQNVS